MYDKNDLLLLLFLVVLAEVISYVNLCDFLCKFMLTRKCCQFWLSVSKFGTLAWNSVNAEASEFPEIHSLENFNPCTVVSISHYLRWGKCFNGLHFIGAFSIHLNEKG